MTTQATRTISKRTDLINALAQVADHEEFIWHGIHLDITREGQSRDIRFPDTDVDFGCLTYDSRTHTIIEAIRDLDFIAAAIAEEG